MKTNQQPNSPRHAAGAPRTTGFTLIEIYLYSYSLNSYYDGSKNRGISSLYGGAGVPPLHFRSASITNPSKKIMPVTGVLQNFVQAAVLRCRSQEKSNCLVNRLARQFVRWAGTGNIEGHGVGDELS